MLGRPQPIVPHGAAGGLRRRRDRVPERVRGVRAGQVLLQRRLRHAGGVPADVVLVRLQDGVPSRLQLRLRRQNQHLHLQRRRLHRRLLPPDHRDKGVGRRVPGRADHRRPRHRCCGSQRYRAAGVRQRWRGRLPTAVLRQPQRWWSRRRLPAAGLQLRAWRRSHTAGDEDLVGLHDDDGDDVHPAVASAAAAAPLLCLTVLVCSVARCAGAGDSFKLTLSSTQPSRTKRRTDRSRRDFHSCVGCLHDPKLIFIPRGYVCRAPTYHTIYCS